MIVWEIPRGAIFFATIEGRYGVWFKDMWNAKRIVPNYRGLEDLAVRDQLVTDYEVVELVMEER
jgi:hypothetical protein